MTGNHWVRLLLTTDNAASRLCWPRPMKPNLKCGLVSQRPRCANRWTSLEGDLIVLGAGGKMGPSLCHMARRASSNGRRIFAVSRFTDSRLVERLVEWGIEVIQGDLLDRQFVATLPTCPLVVYMAGMKFGSSGQPGRAWAMNTVVPAMVCERFSRSRYPGIFDGKRLSTRFRGDEPRLHGGRFARASWRVCNDLRRTRADIRPLFTRMANPRDVDSTELCLRVALRRLG